MVKDSKNDEPLTNKYYCILKWCATKQLESFIKALKNTKFSIHTVILPTVVEHVCCTTTKATINNILMYVCKCVGERDERKRNQQEANSINVCVHIVYNPMGSVGVCRQREFH